jgi:hypothetical protein
MEILVMPGFGLDQGQFNFFVQPDQSRQLLAVEDMRSWLAGTGRQAFQEVLGKAGNRAYNT